jgi:hypothetical protein
MNNLQIKLFFVFIFGVGTINAQNVGINATGAAPDASALLDVVAADKGMLIPRVSITNALAAAPVVTPAISLLVYNTNAAIANGDGLGYYFWDGATWVKLLDGTPVTSATAWQLLGNATTNPTTNFVGTTDAQDLVFRTNNLENMRINTDGNVGIGTTSNAARLYTNIPTTDVTTNYGIYNYHNGADASTTYGIYNRNYSSTNNTKYGIYNNTNNEGTGSHYGIMNYTYMNSASNATGYGGYNYLVSYGTGNHRASYNYLNHSGSGVSTQNYASYNLMNVATSTNTSTIYGEYTDVDYSAGPSYGEYKEMNSLSTYTSTMYGDYNLMQGSGNGASYGMFNDFNNTGTGAKYGVRNDFANVGGTKYGVYNYFLSGTATGTIYGVYNNIQADGNATKYGTYNYISGGLGALRGSYNALYPIATNTSTIYGIYGYVSSLGTGTHYGVYSNAPGGTNDYSGMFYAGNFVANEIGGNYDFRVEGDTRTHALWLDASTNIVNFGNVTATATGNGTTVAGSVVQYVADFDLGGAIWDGTAIGLGSIEYLLDGVAETMINNSFGPTNALTEDLGNAARCWDDIYGDDFWNVSDGRSKKEIVNLDYGLKEVLEMRPVSYVLKDDPFSETKLGLIAQETLLLVPEAVKTHDHKILDENNPKEYTKVELERMAMSYTTLIPVLIKAIQEQQKMIEEQNKKIEMLEKTDH